MTAVLTSIPSPSGNSISLGPLSLNAYGLMIALGVLAAIWMLGRQLEAKRIGTTDDASSVGLWGVAAGIVGSRLYHVATDWDRFADDLGAIPKIWEGGLGIPGGLLAGVAVGVWQGTRRGIRPGALLTCSAPAVPLAQAIGRVGNWFNQELFGKPTDLPWALEIDDAHNLDFPAGTTFHPTFLYEALWNLGLVALLLWIDRRYRLGPGRLFGVYVMGYGIGRYWIEGLRIDPVELNDVAGLRWNQWVALAAIVGGAAYLVATRGRRWPDDVASLRTGGETGRGDGYDERPTDLIGLDVTGPHDAGHADDGRTDDDVAVDVASESAADPDVDPTVVGDEPAG